MRIRRELARIEDGAARDVGDAVPYEAEGTSGANALENGTLWRWCCTGRRGLRSLRLFIYDNIIINIGYSFFYF